jgi:hypothetical protein
MQKKKVSPKRKARSKPKAGEDIWQFECEHKKWTVQTVGRMLRIPVCANCGRIRVGKDWGFFAVWRKDKVEVV